MGALGAAPDSRAMTRAARHVFWCAPTIVDTQHTRVTRTGTSAARSEQVSIPEAYKVFDQAGTLHDRDLEKRLKEVGRQVARFAYLHTSAQAQEFLRAWEGAPVNPGGAKDEKLMPTT
jgi:hypothetical protein